MLHEQILSHAISDINEVSATYDRTAPLVLTNNAVNMALDRVNLPPLKAEFRLLSVFSKITIDQS